MGAFGLTRQGRSPSPMMNGRGQQNGYTPEKVNETSPDDESSEIGPLLRNKAGTQPAPYLVTSLNDDPQFQSFKDQIGEIK